MKKNSNIRLAKMLQIFDKTYRGGQLKQPIYIDCFMNRCFYYDYAPCIRARMDVSNISPSLRSSDYKSPHVVKEPQIINYRIRKLTPTECFRLMDVEDSDIDKLLNSGISNSQLYKMAGNSIVVSCLFHIFRKLFVETQNESQQLTLF